MDELGKHSGEGNQPDAEATECDSTDVKPPEEASTQRQKDD